MEMMGINRIANDMIIEISWAYSCFTPIFFKRLSVESAILVGEVVAVINNDNPINKPSLKIMMNALLKASSVIVRIPKLKNTFPVASNNGKIQANKNKIQMDLSDFNIVKYLILETYNMAQTTHPMTKKESQ
jgi:hypothetical protein